jgi:hypothetical protein
VRCILKKKRETRRMKMEERHMRNIVDVAIKIKEKFLGNVEAQNNIEAVIKDSSFTAPEAMYLRWTDLQWAVFSNIPESSDNWNDNDIEIVSIFSTVPVDEIKKDIKFGIDSSD